MGIHPVTGDIEEGISIKDLQDLLTFLAAAGIGMDDIIEKDPSLPVYRNTAIHMAA
jgi:hypothetical protein